MSAEAEKRPTEERLAWLLSFLVPADYRDEFRGDLIERYDVERSASGRRRALMSLIGEALRSVPALVRWRLTQEIRMTDAKTSSDPFLMGRLTPRATAGRTVRLFRSFYLKALCVFLLIHFPLRIVGHFLRSDESVGQALGGVMQQALLANVLLLVSWTTVEGTLLVILVHRRRGMEVGIRRALLLSLRKLPTFLLARVLFLLGVVVGSALLIIPGVLFACAFMLHGWLIFDQGRGALASLAESAKLVRSRLRTTVGASLPVAGLTFVWVAVGIVFVAFTLRLTAPLVPIFKIAPFTMTLMETGFVMFTILTGLVYVNSSGARKAVAAPLA